MEYPPIILLWSFMRAKDNDYWLKIAAVMESGYNQERHLPLDSLFLLENLLMPQGGPYKGPLRVQVGLYLKSFGPSGPIGPNFVSSFFFLIFFPSLHFLSLNKPLGPPWNPLGPTLGPTLGSPLARVISPVDGPGAAAAYEQVSHHGWIKRSFSGAWRAPPGPIKGPTRAHWGHTRDFGAYWLLFYCKNCYIGSIFLAIVSILLIAQAFWQKI